MQIGKWQTKNGKAIKTERRNEIYNQGRRKWRRVEKNGRNCISVFYQTQDTLQSAASSQQPATSQHDSRSGASW